MQHSLIELVFKQINSAIDKCVIIKLINYRITFTKTTEKVTLKCQKIKEKKNQIAKKALKLTETQTGNALSNKVGF